MQRATATAGRKAGALSFGLALPLLFLTWVGPARALAADAGEFAVAVPVPASSDSVLGRWRNYALASITPQFSWAVRPSSDAPPRVIDRYGTRLEIPVSFKPDDSSGVHVSIGAASAIVSETPNLTAAPALFDFPRQGLERTVVTPSIQQHWGETGVASVTAVLAYQRFASLDLGTTARPEEMQAFAPTSADSSFGTGVRMDFSSALTDRLKWGVAYQSRVNMDAFANYRGMFAEPGDFDIPANASFGLSYALTPVVGLDLGVERVMYSDITPFTSAALPIRFLALLGDGASPNFEWRDLTIYSVGWSLHHAAIGDVELRYTTRQQPSPTSHLLEQALAIDESNSTVSLGWSRATGANSHFGFVATYASSPYFLGLPSYRLNNDPQAGRVEFQALWSIRF